MTGPQPGRQPGPQEGRSGPALSRRTLLRGGIAVAGTAVVVGATELTFASRSGAAVAVPPIDDCATWGAAPATQPLSILSSRPDKILIHHTASANSADLSRSHAHALARSIQQSHFNRNFIDTGQHFTVSRGGFVTEGRHESLHSLLDGRQFVVGAHCTGQNRTSLGIENEGTYTAESPPAALYNSLVTLVAYACQQYAVPVSRIFGHRDFEATQCPGDVFYARLPQLRADVAARLGGGGGGGGGGGRDWPVVHTGQSGVTVRTLQHLLRERGQDVTVDGAFGPRTEAALQAFQRAHPPLTPDGIAGPQTWPVLVVTVRSGARGEAVRAVQEELRQAGSALGVDGAFGPQTDAAVRGFQSAQQLAIDGIVGPMTWLALVG